jgi:PAS domain S-box-containing protein
MNVSGPTEVQAVDDSVSIPADLTNILSRPPSTSVPDDLERLSAKASLAQEFSQRRGAANPMHADTIPAGSSEASGHVDWNDSSVRHHHTRLAQVARATSSAVVITDTEGVTVWVNEGFTRITGYGLDEAVGRTPGQLLQGAETDRAVVTRIGAALRSRQSVAAELINYAKDGRRYWVGMKIEPLLAENGDFDGFMALEADITDRYGERQAIEQLTRRFNMATRVARVGVFERDALGGIMWWSDVMWDIFGVDPATFKLSLDSWLDVIHPEDRERMREQSAGLARNLQAVNWQYRIVRPDGEVRHIRSIGAPADMESITRILGITVDITERIRADEREQGLQSQLRENSHQAGMAEIATGVLHNVGNVLNSLGIANSTARRELRSSRLDRLEQATLLLRNNRDALADFLTHDERGRHLPDYLSALSAQISSNSHALQAELETTEQLLHHLSDIVSAQQQLARVGGQRESIRLSELVETALLVQASELAQIEIVREYEELPPIVANRHKLLQIVVNLVSNARDAIEAGGPGHSRILAKLARDGDHVQLTIEDSGIGMSGEVLSQLWRFGFTTKKKGHGFGLHNSANAAHEAGATLTAHSHGVGHGSRFILRLPFENPEPMLSGVAA